VTSDQAATSLYLHISPTPFLSFFLHTSFFFFFLYGCAMCLSESALLCERHHFLSSLVLCVRFNEVVLLLRWTPPLQLTTRGIAAKLQVTRSLEESACVFFLDFLCLSSICGKFRPCRALSLSRPFPASDTKRSRLGRRGSFPLGGPPPFPSTH